MLGSLTLISRLIHAVLGIGTPNSFPPPLDGKTETEYFARAAAGDAKAREELIVHNLRLVSHVVRKYYSSGKDQEDLVSIGTVGLVKAVDSFDASRGARFATYAARCIQNEILMYFRKEKHRGAEVSVNETIDTDRDGNPLTWGDVLSDEGNMTEELDRQIMSRRALELADALLSPREKQILRLRCGFGCAPRTQLETAQTLGISRSYVSRIERAALEKLANAFNGKGG